MNKYVLDSSVVLAVIQREPGAKFVEDHSEEFVMSAVNLGEVVAKLARDGFNEYDMRVWGKLNLPFKLRIIH